MESILSAFGIDWKLLIAQGVNFALLLAGLSYFLYKPVMKMLADREKTIAEGLQDAEKAKTAVAEVEASRTSILTSAEEEASSVVERAVAEANDERARILKVAQDRCDTAMVEAQKQVTELQRRALLDSEKEVARIAILAAEKILREQS